MSTRRRSSGGEGDTAAGAGEQQQQQQREESVTNIKVAVRCRPFSTSERSRGEKSCFRIENGTACLENPANPSDIHRWAKSRHMIESWCCRLGKHGKARRQKLEK